MKKFDEIDLPVQSKPTKSSKKKTAKKPKKQSALPLGYSLKQSKPTIGFVQQLEASKQACITYDGDAHLLTVGPTGSGKSRSGAIPALLSHTGAMVVIDVKGELYNTTANFRRSLGQPVYAIDPSNLVTKKSAAFNPLDILDLPEIEFGDEVMTIVDLITGGKSSHHDPFWDNNAAGLLNGMIAHIAKDYRKPERTIKDVRSLISHPDLTYELAKRLDDKTVTPEIAIQEFIQYLNLPERETRPSVFGTAKQHFVYFASDSIQSAMMHTSFDIDEFITGKPMTIYFVIPPHKLSTYQKALRLWVGTLLNLLTRRTKKPAQSTLFLIDEAAQLGHMSALLQAVTLMRGYGMQVWTFWQDLSQIKSLYPNEWETILNNMDVIQMLNPSNYRMAQAFAQVDGLISADQLLGMQQCQQALFLKSARKTTLSQKLDYLTDNRFKNLYDDNAFYSH